MFPEPFQSYEPLTKFYAYTYTTASYFQAHQTPLFGLTLLSLCHSLGSKHKNLSSRELKLSKDSLNYFYCQPKKRLLFFFLQTILSTLRENVWT